MIQPEIWDEMRIEDISHSDFRMIAQEFGTDVMLRLIAMFKGSSLYFTDTYIRDFRLRYIRENKTSKTPRELARLLDLSEGYVYQLLRTLHLEAQQINLFDETNTQEESCIE